MDPEPIVPKSRLLCNMPQDISGTETLCFSLTFDFDAMVLCGFPSDIEVPPDML